MDLAQETLHKLYNALREDGTTARYPGRLVITCPVNYRLDLVGNSLVTETTLFYNKELFGGEKYTGLRMVDTVNDSTIQMVTVPPWGKYNHAATRSGFAKLKDAEIVARGMLQHRGDVIRDAMKNGFGVSDLVDSVRIDMAPFHLELAKGKLEFIYKYYDNPTFTVTSKECTERAMLEQQVLLAYQSGKLEKVLEVF